jgi:hypothetical protein
MSASSLESVPRTQSLNKATLVLWWLALALGAFFVATAVPRYFIFNEAAYGPYHWPRAGYLLPHVLAGLVAIVLGPLQFWSRIRSGYPHIHRLTGRIYLAAILLGSLAGMALAVASPSGFAYRVGLFCLACAWLATSAMAFIAVKRRNFIQHREWMIRSYVLTFAFVIFRFLVNGLNALGGDPETNATAMAWACWVVPLFITELVLQGRKVFAAR